MLMDLEVNPPVSLEHALALISSDLNGLVHIGDEEAIPVLEEAANQDEDQVGKHDGELSQHLSYQPDLETLQLYRSLFVGLDRQVITHEFQDDEFKDEGHHLKEGEEEHEHFDNVLQKEGLEDRQ